MTASTKKIGYILLYYCIAIALRYYIMIVRPEFFTNSGYWMQVALEGIGPLFGGLLLVKMFNRPNDIRLFSFGIWQSLFLIAVPVVLFTLVGFVNTGKPYIGAIRIVGAAIMYGMFEEYGWRGYLQTELKGMKNAYKYLLISVMWYFWHLEFSFTMGNLITFSFLVLGSFGIGMVAEKTKSLILVGIFHAFFNLFYLLQELEGITSMQIISIISISVFAIIFMMKIDGKRKRLANVD